MIFLTTKHKNSESTGLVISHWMSTRYTIEFMGLWEKMHNPDFNVTEFSNIRNESGSHGFVLSSKNWINSTNAHKDIAFEFASWISAEFKLFLIKEGRAQNPIQKRLTPDQMVLWNFLCQEQLLQKEDTADQHLP